MPLPVPIRTFVPKAAVETPLKSPPVLDEVDADSIGVVVTVFNQPHVVRDCLEAFHARTPKRVRLVIVDDASAPYTKRLLRSFVDRMTADGRDALIIENPTNLKYTKTINRGVSEIFSGGARWAVTLNSDTLVTHGWIERMHHAAQADKSIGIVCPFMSDAALLTLPMAPGSHYMDTADRVAAVAPDMIVPAVTPVGACMMVRRDVWDTCGPFDEEVYPHGYGEEGELWARAVSAEYSKQQKREPFKAIVVPSAWIYHESHASFGAEARGREHAGTEVFKSRWGHVLKAHYELSSKQSVREQLVDKIQRVRVNNRPKVAFYVRGIMLCGGVLALVNICNQLIELGIDATIAHEFDEYSDWAKMPARFRPIHVRYGESDNWTKVGGFEEGVVLATTWSTGGFVQSLGNRWKGLKTGAFIQDREDLFRDNKGRLQYTRREEFAPYLALASKFSVVNSAWVATSMAEEFGVKPTQYIPIGVDPDLFHPPESRPDGPIRVLSFSRPSTPRRGFPILAEVFRELGKMGSKNVELVTYDQSPGTNVPAIHMGKLPQKVLADLMRSCHILIEPSYTQGWGMPAQEMMSTGGAVISTDNGGIHNYGVDGKNCRIVPPNSDAILHAARDLIGDAALRDQLGKQARADMLRFSWKRVGATWAKTLGRAFGWPT